MKSKITLSVGIPAFNEEENILHLINSILGQKQKKYKLIEIIVASDCSTDRTTDIVKCHKNPLIKLIDGKKRQGQQFRQNQLVKTFRGDLLAIIEGDILPIGDTTLEELVKPFLDNNPNLGMVIGRPVSIKPNKFYEKVLYHGVLFKQKLFSTWKNGINVYTAGGHSMKVISKPFAKRLDWPKHVPEDAYTYLRLKQLGFAVVRNPKAQAYMRSVTNFGDRKKQVKKFISGKKALKKYFSNDFMDKEYIIPYHMVAKSLLNYFLKEPFWTTLLIGEIAINRLAVLKRSSFNALHEIYKSSKILIDATPEMEKMFNKPTISVGIPAFNEASNIKFLIRSLLKQKIMNGKLLEIIVISDGSTDETVEIARSFKNSKVKVFNNPSRSGVANVQNQIVKKVKGDILIMLNADVLPYSNDFIDKIISPINHDNHVGLVGADTESATPSNFIEKVIAESHELKKKTYKKINKGNNIYLCHGRARAFTKKLYKKIIWPNDIPEDAFSYLFCKIEKQKFVFAPDAKVIFRSPSNLNDHLKQSLRFLAGKKRMETKYHSLTQKNYTIPLSAYINTGVISLIWNPIVTISYILINLYVKMIRYKKIKYSSVWDISESSKKIIYN